MNTTHFHLGKLALAMVLTTGSATANASAFAIAEQSVTGLGTAFSSASAGAEDASTIYYNAAGISRLKGVHYSLGVNLVRPSAEFDDNGSTHFTGASLDANNEDGGDAGTLGVVPNFYYVRELNNKWTVGLGINAPFGLASEYDDGWVGRYHALDSELTTINVNPTVAYKVDDRLSLGFGVNIQYIDARLTNAVDFGGICFGSLGAGTCTGLGLSPQGSDGEVEVTADDIGLGYNFGFQYQATPSTRIGAAYRSRIKYKLEGDADFTTPTAATAVAAGARLVNSDVEADVDLPDSLSIGFHHQATDRLAITGDIAWTNWSLLDELRIEFDNGAADNVTTLDWDDTYRYSLGMTYNYSSAWTLRAGVAFDEGAAQSAESLTPRVPDEDRTWLAFGATYSNPKNNFKFDLGFAHLFVDDADVRRVSTTAGDENFFRGNLVGDYDLDVNILSAQASWLF